MAKCKEYVSLDREVDIFPANFYLCLVILHSSGGDLSICMASLIRREHTRKSSQSFFDPKLRKTPLSTNKPDVFHVLKVVLSGFFRIR